MESSERKKRKHVEKEDQKKDEEKKMDKFYALIKRNNDTLEKIQKQKKDFTLPWIPTFRPEDFTDEHAEIKDGRSSQQLLAPSNKKPQDGEGEGEGGGTGLDLNLSL